MQIPWQNLSEAALRGLIEEFISREGTKYGEIEYSLDEMCDQVLGDVKSGRVLVVFDPESETASLLDAESAKRETGFDEA